VLVGYQYRYQIEEILMLNKQAIYVCCISKPWISVIKQLLSLGIKPVHITHWRDDHREYKKFFEEECHLQTVEDAWKGMGFPFDGVVLDEPLLEKIAWYEVQAIGMMSRLDPTERNFSAVNRQIFFRQLVGHWLQIIRKHDVKLVVSPSIPHRVFDYALYVASRLEGIYFLTFQQTPFGSNSILLDDINSMPPLLEAEAQTPSSLVKERVEIVLKNYNDAIPDYMLKHRLNNSSLVKPFLKIISRFRGNINDGNWYKLVRPNTYWIRAGYHPNYSSPGWLEYFLTKIKNRIKISKLKKLYSKLTNKKQPNGARFIFVALHYQPEETTCPTGGAYNDQLIIINLLNDLLPPDLNIVVKEHKSQFYADQEGAAGRNVNFYHRLSAISNRIYFSSINEDPFSLIDKAIATVTVSGTVGWESAIRGTPTLVFGRAWYEQMPNVYRIRSKQDLMEAWTKIESNNSLANFQEILNYHSALEANFITATHYKSYIGKDDIDYDESARNLVEAITEYLRKKCV
jgi:hypothetical protein